MKRVFTFNNSSSLGQYAFSVPFDNCSGFVFATAFLETGVNVGFALIPFNKYYNNIRFGQTIGEYPLKIVDAQLNDTNNTVTVTFERDVSCFIRTVVFG